eukprot:g7044.t1
MAECLVRLALGAGLLRGSGGCVLLPSEQQIVSRAPAAAAPAAAPANPAAGAGPAPVVAPAPSSAGAAPAGAAKATGEEGLLSQLVPILQQPKPAPVDLSTSDDEGEALDVRVGKFFTTQHQHWEMHQPILSALDVLRDETGDLTWFDFTSKLDVLTSKTITLGLVEDRTMLDLIRHRGDILIRKNGDPRRVLMLFAETLPNHRRVSRFILKRDVEKLKQINKIAGKNLGKGGHGAQVVAAQQSFVAASATTPALASALPGTVTLSLQSASSQGAAGAAGSAVASSARADKGRRGPKSGGRPHGGGAGAAPPSVPSTQAAQARLDYNKQLQAKQQAMTSDPNGNFCHD